MNNGNFKIKLFSSFAVRSMYFQYSYHDIVDYLPYGLGALVSFLRNNGFCVDQEDLSMEFTRGNKCYPQEKCDPQLFIENKINNVSLKDFNLIGVSIYSYLHFSSAMLIAKKLKQNSGPPIVFGGAFMTLYGHLYHELFDFVDYAIVGDGMTPLLRLIEHLQGKVSLSDIPNLIYKDKERIITNTRQYYPIEDMPVPDFDGLPIELYRKKDLKGNNLLLLPYQTSRGCANKCTFCNNCNISHKIEYKTYNKIISELKLMKARYDNVMFDFCDCLINSSRSRLNALMDTFISNDLNITWMARTKIGNLDDCLLKKMRQAGCQILIFGVESGSSKVLKMMKKNFTARQLNETLKDTSKAGITTVVLLMSGYLYETKRDVTQTVKFIKKNKRHIDYFSLMRFALVYGSPIHSDPDKYGISNISRTESRHSFKFDEIKALKWKDKVKQQKKSEEKVLRALYRYVRLPKERKGIKLFIAIVRFDLFNMVRKPQRLIKKVLSANSKQYTV